MDLEPVSRVFRALVVMTTPTADIREVFRCFREGCDGYIQKPIDLEELLNLMRSWQLVR